MTTRAELDIGEKEAERYARDLQERMPGMAEVFQEVAQRLIGIASGEIKPKYKKLLLVDGKPPPKAKKVPPAA